MGTSYLFGKIDNADLITLPKYIHKAVDVCSVLSACKWEGEGGVCVEEGERRRRRGRGGGEEEEGGGASCSSQ